MDPHSKRLMDACDWRGLEITPDHIRRAKQAYFANISYIDDKIGEILAVLEATRQEAHRRLPLRPRRDAGRTRPLVQDELLRRLGPRAPDDRRARHAAGRSIPRSPPSTSLPTLARWPGSRWTRSRPGPMGVNLARGERRPAPPGGDGICRRRQRSRRWSACATAPGNTSAAPPTPRCCSTWRTTPMSATNLATDPRAAEILDPLARHGRRTLGPARL
jgi:hypothetical protein